MQRSILHSNTYSLPAWTARFKRVREELNRESSTAAPDRLTIVFENGTDDWWEQSEGFAKFLQDAHIPRDSRHITEGRGGMNINCQKVRYAMQAARTGASESLLPRVASWTEGNDDTIDIKSLYALLGRGDDPRALVERVRVAGCRCGLDLQPIERVTEPSQDMLFMMALRGGDRDLVSALATPELLSEPLRGAAFEESPLNVTLLNADDAMTFTLLGLGARTDVRCNNLTRRTVGELAIDDPDEDFSEDVRNMIRHARARELAQDAIREMDRASAVVLGIV